MQRDIRAFNALTVEVLAIRPSVAPVGAAYQLDEAHQPKAELYILAVGISGAPSQRRVRGHRTAQQCECIDAERRRQPRIRSGCCALSELDDLVENALDLRPVTWVRIGVDPTRGEARDAKVGERVCRWSV